MAAALSVGLLAWLASAGAAGAQITGLDEWAETAVALSAPVWKGQRVPWPEPAPRPDSAGSLRSLRHPLAVHAGRGVPAARLEAALAALERAHRGLLREGWELPPPDGPRGGDGSFDLYLVPGLAAPEVPEPALSESAQPAQPPELEARVDVPWACQGLDGALVHALLDAAVPRDQLEAAVTEAYAAAVLLSLDPAEAPAWRAAYARLLASRLGADPDRDGAASAAQQRPWATPIAERPSASPAGVTWLAALTESVDGGDGRLARELYQFARQRTWEGEGLRGSPDLWEVLRAALGPKPEALLDRIEGVALSRALAGPSAGPSSLRTPVALLAHPGWAQLPEHVRAEQPLEALGSGYVRVDVAGAPRGSQLRIWLQGEFGVRWSLIAARLDASGALLSEVRAPVRKLPRSYLLVELLPGTASVLVAVTNLSSRLPDADRRDDNERAFTLILDR